MSSHPPSVSNMAAHHFTGSLEFFVEDRKKLLRDVAKIRHIQELFSVQVATVPTDHEWVTVTLCSTSQEFVEKAKCYILALCCPERHSDLPCDRTGDKLAALLFGNPELYSKLESQYLTCIQYIRHPELHGVIRVQGEEQRVSQTVAQLHNMLELIDPSPPPTLSPPPHLPPSDERDGVNAGLLRAMLSTVERKVAMPPSHNYPAHLLQMNFPEVPVSRKQVDYYVHLGFQQEIVENTIASLGPGAHSNDIMHRLNMMRGIRAQPKTVVMLEPATLVMPPSCNVGEGRRTMDPSNLRPVVVDGSNVAMRHGNGQVFSCRGIQIVVDYFKARGHDHIKVFVPEWRKESSRPETPISDQHILDSLERDKMLVYTPSRKIQGRRIVCYDDRFVVRYAQMEGGVIISNDQYRDLMQEDPEWRKVIEQRLIQFTFANDHFMPPDDPLGKDGPSLDQLLVKDPRELQRANKKLTSDSRSSSLSVCPHLGNCTFGRKCRYYHPDREPQKQEHPIGSGSSGGSHTPSTSSRSATSSPSPDNRMHSSKSSREDLYGQFSNHSSLDDLQRPLAGIDIGELSDKLAQTILTSPSKGSYLESQSYSNHLSVKFPLQTPGHVKSVPSLDTMSQGQPLMEGSRPPNHTFPQVAQTRATGRSGNVTEDLTYRVQTSVHPNHQGMVPSYEDNMRASQAFISRDASWQGQLYMPQSGEFIDATQLRRDGQTQLPPSRYGAVARMGVVSPSYPSHQMMPPGYEHARTAGDQSIPMHNLHQQHFSPNRQPHPQVYAPPPIQHPYQEASYHRTGRGDGFSDRDDLYRRTLAVLPGCKDRINHVLREHPELTSADLPSLVETVRRMN